MLEQMKFLLLMTILMLSSQLAAQTVTIRFDNSGPESGVTTPGTTEFSFMGSNWSGGQVFTAASPPLYASGSFSYRVVDGSAMVEFDQAVIDVSFFFVHGGGSNPGSATAFNATGDALATVDSNQASGFGDSGNFVAFDSAEPIARIEFTGGIVDNFSFMVTEEEPFEFDFTLAEGNWVNPDPVFANSRQGLMFDFGPSLNILFVAWFTYTSVPMMPPDDAPMDIGSEDQRWFTALLNIDGNVATGTMRFSTGGEFDAPAPAFLDTREAGTISIEFTACDQATVTYSFDEPSLSRAFEIIPLEKSVNAAGFNCEPAGN